MLLIATALAVVTAFVATVVYANVDANRKVNAGPTTVPPNPAVVSTLPGDDGPTTTKVPEILSQDDLTKKLNASIRSVQTLDQAGQPVQGTAFVVGSFGGQTLLLTSFSLVEAGTRDPAPPITLNGGQTATLWTWQPQRDLALLVIGGSVESLPWATAPPKNGDKVYAGVAGQKMAQGVVTGVADDGIATNIFVDGSRQGAPIVNQKGEVLAMASAAYNPGGRATDTTFIGVPIKAACDQVLRCGGGNTVPGATPTTIAGTTTTKP
jgi:hypothetical protein